MIAYGAFVISLVDNICRIYFQRKFADIHPLVTILGFIIGVSLFGIPGIIFGPLLISYFLILLKIFRDEYIAAKVSIEKSEQVKNEYKG
jgi:predicted PurR-regulated permease PerM